jgi:orotate phosphoribosyltransferase
MIMKKSRLLELIRERSYREGDFTLSSGKKSTFYIDLKATTLHPEGAALVGELAWEACEAEGMTPHIQGVGGLTLGADPIATSLSLAAWSHGSFWPAFIVRKGAKEHGTGKPIEGTENLAPGARVLVVEDVATTGKSAIEAVDRLREGGYQPIAVLCILDREQGASEACEARGLKLVRLASWSELRAQLR